MQQARCCMQYDGNRRPHCPMPKTHAQETFAHHAFITCVIRPSSPTSIVEQYFSVFLAFAEGAPSAKFQNATWSIISLPNRVDSGSFPLK